MGDEQGPSFGDLARGGVAREPTALENRCRITVSNVWLTDGRGPFSGLFLLRPKGADDERQIGVVCSSMTGGAVWASLPPAAQGDVYAAASITVLGSGSGAAVPEWFSKNPANLLPPDLCGPILARYQEWRAESFRDGAGVGAETSRRPVVERAGPVGGAVGAAA
jgi:hypothetical protein